MKQRKNLQADPAQAAFAREAKALAVLRAANAKAQASYAALNKAPADPAAAYKAHMARYADAKAAEADYEAACRAADAYKKQATPADMADGFTRHAKQIIELCNRFAYRPDARDLAREYITWRQVVENWRSLTTEHFPYALPEVPSLIGTDHYSGLVHVADYCKKAAKRLCTAPTAAPKPRKSDTIKGYILEALAAVPAGEYVKAATVLIAVKEKHPDYDRRRGTIARALTALANTGALQSKSNAGYRLPPKQAGRN